MRRLVGTAAHELPWIESAYAWQRDRVRARLTAAARDRVNRRRHGPSAPRFAERLWVDPSMVRSVMVHGSALGNSARVSDDFPASLIAPLDGDAVFVAAVAHWVDGLSWEQTGEIERMERAIRAKGPIKGCRSRADILRRCARLDEIFQTVEREKRLRTQAEAEPGTFREVGGIGMHIGPGGVPIRAANGRHRFAMARILGLPPIPVRIALVHPDALAALGRLRRPPAVAPLLDPAEDDRGARD